MTHAPTAGRVSDVIDTLRAELNGQLVLPADELWDTVRQAWHLDVDQAPAAVVVAESVADVVAVILCARQLGWRVAPQGTGHNAGPLGDLADTVLVKTSAMRAVEIDPATRTARVEAGALWLDVTAAAAKHGLVALAGSAPDVGVVGYTLGGGLSWLGRSHGLAANSVTAIEVVTADGTHRRVDEDTDTALFWALRGGGGSFGVVTALEFRLYELTDIYAGVLFFPLERAAEVLRAWHDWLPSVPETVTSVGRVLRFPTLPELPAALSGRSWAVIEAACQLDTGMTEELLAPLRALSPEIDTFDRVPVTALSELHMDPPAPVPGRGDGMLLGPLGAEGIAAFARVAASGTADSLLSLELRHLGGALRPTGTHGVVDGFAADFAFFAVGITPTAGAARTVEAAVTAVQHTLAPWTTGSTYLNFAERPKHGDALFGRAAHQALRAIKSRYDSGDLIRSNHPVRPEGH